MAPHALEKAKCLCPVPPGLVSGRLPGPVMAASLVGPASAWYSTLRRPSTTIRLKLGAPGRAKIDGLGAHADEGDAVP